MTWHKRDDHFELNPKVVAAGRDGAVVFSVLLGINSHFECGGVLDASYWSVALLRARLGVFGMPAGRVKKALDACMRSGLVRELGEGQLGIAGYDEEWSPRYSVTPTIQEPSRSANAIRQERYRNAKRNADRNAGSVTSNADHNASSNAPRNAASVTPRARASGSGDGEREEEGDRSLSGGTASTSRARTSSAERASPSAPLQGEPEPEPDPDSYADPDAVANELPPEHRAGYLASLARIRAEKSQRRERTQNGTAIDSALARGVYGEGKS